jgi:hypothetical protein
LPTIMADKRYKAVPTHNERRSLFEKFLLKCAEDEKKAAAKAGRWRLTPMDPRLTLG